MVRGWKAIGTGVAFANEIFMGVLWKPGIMAEQIVFGLIPANHPEWGPATPCSRSSTGTPLWVIKLLTMQRVEYQADGPDYPSIRMRPEYIKQQDVATTQDVEAATAVTSGP